MQWVRVFDTAEMPDDVGKEIGASVLFAPYIHNPIYVSEDLDTKLNAWLVEQDVPFGEMVLIWKS